DMGVTEAQASLSPGACNCPTWSAAHDGHALGDSTDIVRLLNQSFGVPHAALYCEEIAIVDLDASADFVERIDDRMDNVATKNSDVSNAQRFATHRLDLKILGVGDAAPKHVIFTSCIHADHSGHPVIVRQGDLFGVSKPEQDR